MQKQCELFWARGAPSDLAASHQGRTLPVSVVQAEGWHADLQGLGFLANPSTEEGMPPQFAYAGLGWGLGWGLALGLGLGAVHVTPVSQLHAACMPPV